MIIKYSLISKAQKLLKLDNKKTYSAFNLIARTYAYPLTFPVLLACLYLTILASSMLNTYNPGIGEQLIFLLTQKDAADLIKPVLLSRFGVDLLIGLIDCLTHYFQSRISRKVERKMQEDFYKSLLSKDIEYFDGKKIGDLTSKMQHDLQSLKNLSIMDLAQVCKKLFTMGWSVIFMLQLSPRLVLILLVLMIPRVGLMWIGKDYVRTLQRTMGKMRSENNSIATEAFVNIRTVKAFSTEQKEFNKFSRKLEEIAEKDASLARKDLIHTMANNLLKTLMFAVIALQGAYLVLDIKQFTPFQLSKFIAYTREFSMAILTIEGNVKKIFTSLVNAERVFTELDENPKIKTNEEVIVYDKGVRGEIIFKDVNFAYPHKKNVQVLKNVNLQIKKGEHVAIVGESGGGKSTIISLLQRLYDPTQGEVLIDGKNLKDYNLQWLHSRMGYISQDPALFSGSLEDNVVYGVENYDKGELEKVVESAYMNKFVEDKKLFPEGLQSNVGERGNKLSGGQKQRVAIARALIKKPDILILDEATSALDSESEHQIMKGFETLLKNKGQTTIVIAHRLSTIMNCDKILVCQGGEIVECGNHMELVMKEDGVYRNLVEKQLIPVSPITPITPVTPTK